MQKLKKTDRSRFELVCFKIREALHLEHYACRYTFEKEQEGERLAEQRMYEVGRRLWIAVFPVFWTLEAEEQLRTLIHEHIHGVMIPYDQMVHKVVDWTHRADKDHFDMMTYKTREHVVDHLESVLYDLLKGRFE